LTALERDLEKYNQQRSKLLTDKGRLEEEAEVNSFLFGFFCFINKNYCDF
jgi:hypothetical protein